MSSEQEQRAAVLAAASSWLGTKYHHRAMLKGIGVDCATLLVTCFTESGLIPPVSLPDYSPQWHLNDEDEKYLAVVLEHCAPVDAPQPGDIAMWRFGKRLGHGAIVVDWPRIIHAEVGSGCILGDAARSTRLMYVGRGEAGAGKPRECRFFSYWAKR